MTKNRKYSCRDVDMLVASKTIAESFRVNIAELSAARTDWTESYATDLLARIDQAMETHLGVDSRKDLRAATATLASLQIPAKRDLSYFKTQIEDDFRRDTVKRDDILKTLGFTRYLRGVQMGNQESLIQLLYTFKTNMTGALRQEIAAKGLNPTLIDTIAGYAETFKQANILQETYKESSREISKEASDAFNAIYEEVIGICKKASSYYQYEPIKKEQFTFTRVLANMGITSKSSVKPGSQPTT